MYEAIMQKRHQPPISVTKTNFKSKLKVLQWVLLYLQIYSWRILKTMQSVPPPLNHLSGAGTLMTFLQPHTQQHLLHFKSHLNKQNMSMQFTTEEENNNKLSFLDVEIERENGHFITSIYRKKKHLSELQIESPP